MNREEWTRIDSRGEIRAAEYPVPGGRCRSLMIRLSDHSFLIYSPGKSLAASASLILGRNCEVKLLAPNGYHSLGLDAWTAEFENSVVFASDQATPRLVKRSTFSIADDLSALTIDLPAHITLHILPACRFGEVWLSIDADSKVYWAVCDAFFNLSTLPENLLMKSLLKLGRYGPGLEISRPFQTRGIRDKTAYRNWAIQRFSNGRENILIPCHGDIDDAPEVSARVIDLLNLRF